MGWLVVERKLSIEEVLSDAAEAFYVGTATVLAPVTIINYRGVDRTVGDGKPGPRGRALRQALVEIQRQERQDLWNWVMEVPE
jgi:branched-subunit amino acid aminotransferase/4-amino-4-deoxychorismate lyase